MNFAITLVTQLLPLIPGVVKGVGGAIDAFTHGTGLLQTIVAENRDPTSEEWTAWTNRITAAHNAIQAA